LQPISVSAEGCHHRGLQRAGRSDDLRDGTGMLSDTIQQTFQRQSTGIIALQFLRHVLNGRHHVGAILKLAGLFASSLEKLVELLVDFGPTSAIEINACIQNDLLSTGM
jgi:hypothetical protein